MLQKCVCSLEQNDETRCGFQTREMFGHLVPKLCLVFLLIFVKVEIQAAYYRVLLEVKTAAEFCNDFQSD